MGHDLHAAAIVGKDTAVAKAIVAADIGASKVAATALLTALEMLEGHPLLRIEHEVKLPPLTPFNSVAAKDIEEEVELRNSTPAVQARAPVSPDVVRALSIPLFFDYLGVRLNGPKASGKRSIINWDLPDLGEIYMLNLENSALSYLAGKHAPDADATVTLDRQVLNRIAMRQTTLADAIHRALSRSSETRASSTSCSTCSTIFCSCFPSLSRTA